MWSVATGGNTPYHHNKHPAVMPKKTSYRLGDWIMISYPTELRHMETVNPYRPTADAEPRSIAKNAITGMYAMKHGLAFHVAFLLSTELRSFFLFGFHQSIASFLADIYRSPPLLAFGFVTWLFHFALALLNSRVRRTGPLLNSALGGSAVILWSYLDSLFSDYGPDSLTMPWSWVPEYTKLTLYVGGSIAIVFFTSIIADNHRMHRSGGG